MPLTKFFKGFLIELMLGLQKKILLLLAGALDTAVDWDKALSSRHINLKFASFKDDYFQRTVKGMLRVGEIEKVIRRGEPVFRITSQGGVKLRHSVPLAKRIGEKWDGKWRMVIFDIPEKEKRKRDELRRKLKDLGFACWQKSVYISPFDVASDLAEYLSVNDLADFAIALEAKKIFVGNEKEMARKLWRLDDLNSKYQELLEEYESKKEKRGLQEEYLSILETDPYLPKELLPEIWFGNIIRKKVFK